MRAVEVSSVVLFFVLLGLSLQKTALEYVPLALLCGWLLALSREPRQVETDRMMRFLNARRDSKEPEAAVWTAAARVILNTDEFMTRQ